MSHFDFSPQPHPFIATNKINNLVAVLTSSLPQTDNGKASGKHPINSQFEPHKCPLMRRRLSPRIYPARPIRLTRRALRSHGASAVTSVNCEQRPYPALSRHHGDPLKKSVDHSPNTRRRYSSRISSATLVRESRTSSANGAFGRHDRHDNAGMRLLTAASG